MKKKQKRSVDYVVATVEEVQAIDFTKIYKITPIENIKKGTPLRFDSAEKIITTDFPFTDNN